jgi:hypothetical protein
MAGYYQNLTLGALSRIALSLLVGALFKKLGLQLNTPCNVAQLCAELFVLM